MKLIIKTILLLITCCIAVVLLVNVIPKERLLLSAVQDRDDNMIDWMIKLGADVNTHGASAYTPLNLAVRNGDIDIVRKLLSLGANPNQPANYGSGDKIAVGNLSLVINYTEHPVPLVQLLIEAGVRVADDPVALKDAIEEGEIELVSLLIKNGGNVDDGLQFAVMYDQIDIAELMLESGADPNVGISLARTMRNQEVLHLLEANGASVKTLPREQIYPECYKVTENGGKVRVC